MHLFPYDRFTIQTQKSLLDVINTLETHIEAPRGWRSPFSRNHLPYAGTISNSGFEIRRIIHYSNSFLPNIRGRFEPSSAGTRVRITMSLHPFVIAFLLFWLSIWYGISLLIFLSNLLSGDITGEAGLFLGMPIVMLAFFWFAFWSEANYSRRELTAIILGQPLRKQAAGLLAPRTLWILPIAAIIIGNIVTFNLNFSPAFKSRSLAPTVKSCSQDITRSPYCKFSLLYTLEGHPTASAIALSPDGKTLVSGGKDKAIKVWDLLTGTLKRTLQSDSGVINSLAIAPDGKTVVSSSGDRMVRIWDITADKYPQMLKGHTNVSLVEISADGKTIVSSGYDEIKIWNLKTGDLKKTLPDLQPTGIEIGPLTLGDKLPYFRLLTISSDGQTALVKLESKLVAWDLATDRQTVLRKKRFEHINFGRISLDGKIAVTTSYRQPKNYLQIWDLSTGTLKAEGVVSASRIHRANLALSGDRIFGDTEEGLKVWNLQTAELEATLDRQNLTRLVVSTDGKILVGITGDLSGQNTKIKVFQP